MKAINPYTGKVIKDYTEHTPEEVTRIIEQVDQAWSVWRNSSFEVRSGCMYKLAAQLEEQKDQLSELITGEMGKIRKEAASEIDKCAWVCRYYAEKAEQFLKSEPVKTDASESYVCFRPIGTVLAVMPWNFPFWQVFRFLAPALMAGNTGLLKHASNVPGCSLAIEKLVTEAGFPENVFRTILIPGSSVGSVIEDPKIKAVTLTGSTPAGKSVAGKAGSLLKKTVLELGGSDPYLVLEDADLEKAARLCISGRLMNAGQSCIGAKRFIILEGVYEAFKAEFVRLMKEARYGDPDDDTSAIGPLSRKDLRDQLHEQVAKSVEKGATIACGGFIPEGDHAFYPPTVLENVQPGMPAYEEELFGPVASLFRVKDEYEAVRIANDTAFGLGSAIFTSDMNKAKELAEKGLEAGNVFVNSFVKSDPRLPFGGIKESGYGRELSLQGIREFVNIKTIVIA